MLTWPQYPKNQIYKDLIFKIFRASMHPDLQTVGGSDLEPPSLKSCIRQKPATYK